MPVLMDKKWIHEWILTYWVSSNFIEEENHNIDGTDIAEKNEQFYGYCIVVGTPVQITVF